MNSQVDIACGCKGIRKCLVCEESKGICDQVSPPEQIFQYNYCPVCNMCWPEKSSLAIQSPEVDFPLYLDGIVVIPNFLSNDEEASIVSDIDSMTWMPSQSGRRKQDFGPRVNFKKKKVKKGDFKGFPRFSRTLLQKLHLVPLLSDFRAVELCNLDYDPTRGSAIDPHTDDAWLWGNRLITVNLYESTFLTLTPAKLFSCNCSSVELNCFQEKSKSIRHSVSAVFDSSESKHCNHMIDGFQQKVQSLCDIFRLKQCKIQVRIPLIVRSILVLSDCARYNWFHEIKRQDVNGRRIAVTFRELSDEFLADGKNSEIGEELMKIADVTLSFESQVKNDDCILTEDQEKINVT